MIIISSKPTFTRNKTFVHEPVSLGYEDLSDESSAKGRTYLTPSGKKYPSITTVLGAKGKEAIIEWRKRVGEEEANRITRHACSRGTALHLLAEKYLNNEEEIFKEDEMPHVVQSFKTVQRVLDDHIGKVILQECPLYSDQLGIAGRVDLIAEFDDHLSVIDFKTSSRRKSEAEIENYFMQAAFYAAAFYERTGIAITESVIIMVVDADPEPIIFKQSTYKWIPDVLNAIQYYNKQKLFGHAF
jgi:CRISPR/Cas system-associated exonuclease Cas4 (RecB family)